MGPGGRDLDQPREDLGGRHHKQACLHLHLPTWQAQGSGSVSSARVRLRANMMAGVRRTTPPTLPVTQGGMGGVLSHGLHEHLHNPKMDL